MAVDKTMVVDPDGLSTMLEEVFQTVENNYIRRTEHASDISDLEAKFTDGSVTKVGTSTVGSATRGIYLLNGVPTQMDEAVPTSHAASTTEYGGGTASLYGHVKLSDNYETSAGTAAQSIGASSKAVADAYGGMKSYMDGIVADAYEFDIDENGDLYVTYNITSGATFAINENGNLIMTY